MISIRKSLFGLIIASIIIGSFSCDKEKMKPIVKLAEKSGYQAKDTMLAVGDTIKVLLDMTWNGKNKVNDIELRVNDQLAGKYSVDIDQGQFSINIVKGLSDPEIWDFIVSDDGGNVTTISLKLTKDPDSKYSGLKYFDSIYLGAQSNPTRPGFVSIMNSTYYRLEAAFQNQAVIDLLFYYDETDKATIASPGANIQEGVFQGDWDPSNWDTRNTARFLKVDISKEEFFGMIHDGYIIENFNDVDAKRKAKELAAEDMYLFELENGKKGIFYVYSVVEAEDGEVNIALKIQE
jgi:hypothetical protein